MRGNQAAHDWDWRSAVIHADTIEELLEVVPQLVHTQDFQKHDLEKLKDIALDRPL